MCSGPDVAELRCWAAAANGFLLSFERWNLTLMSKYYRTLASVVATQKSFTVMPDLLAKPGLFPALLIHIGTLIYQLKFISQAICCIMQSVPTLCFFPD